jgi:hypothetical protein
MISDATDALSARQPRARTERGNMTSKNMSAVQRIGKHGQQEY